MLHSPLSPLARRALEKAPRRTTLQRAIGILRKYGSSAHLYLPGIGTVSGLTAGNYLDSAGATLATVDSPVGLVLDAAGSVGAELVTNGDFATDTGWTKAAGVTISGGAANFAAVTSTVSLYQNAGLVAGKTYQVTFTITSISAGTVSSQLNGGGNVSSPAVSTAGTYSAYLSNPVANGVVSLIASAFTGSIDNISVKEVTGIHATQSTTSNKPLLRRGLLNLLTYSNQIDNAAWGKNNATVTANAATAPDGTLTADLVVCGASQSNWFRQAVSIPATAIRYTYAFVAKPEASASIVIIEAGATASSIAYTLTASGSMEVNNTGGSVAGTVLSLGDGYYLCTFSYTSNGSQTTLYLNNAVVGAYMAGAGLFTGSLTAQQILDSGGIPLTTTAAASNATSGKYSWTFDGSNDSLALSAPLFQMADDHCVIAGVNVTTNPNPAGSIVFSQRSTVSNNPLVASLSIDYTGKPGAGWRNDAGTLVAVVSPDAVTGAAVIAIRQIGNVREVWVNGVLKATNTTALGTSAAITNAAIGVHPTASPSGYLLGGINSVLPIKGTVSDDELLTLERFVASLTPNAPSF